MASDDMNLIRAIVRGERDWADLSELGIAILPIEGGFEILNNDQVRGTASTSDVATGMVRLSTEPSRLHDWASILLAGSSFVDLDLESDADGDALLQTLWDLSFGKPFTTQALALASRIVARS
jgi:hypothetical protein